MSQTCYITHLNEPLLDRNCTKFCFANLIHTLCLYIKTIASYSYSDNNTSVAWDSIPHSYAEKFLLDSEDGGSNVLEYVCLWSRWHQGVPLFCISVYIGFTHIFFSQFLGQLAYTFLLGT